MEFPFSYISMWTCSLTYMKDVSREAIKKKTTKFVISVWIFIEAGRETLSWQKCLNTFVNIDLSKSLEMWVLVIAPSITVYMVWVTILIPLSLMSFSHEIRTMLFIHLLWNIGRPLSWNNWATVSEKPHMQLSPPNPERKPECSDIH